MRATIEIDGGILKSAMKALSVKSEKEATEAGLKLVLERAAKQNMTKMKGKVKLWPGYKRGLNG